MSNLRKRNVNDASKNPSEENPSALKKVRFAIENVIFRQSTKRSDLQRIENGSVVLYLILFVVVLVLSTYLVEYLHELDDDNVIASQRDSYTRLFLGVSCSNDYGNKFRECSPKKCGRVIKDGLFTSNQLTHLKSLVLKGMKHGGGSGGATILDLHTGALSYKDKFVNLNKLAPNAFTKDDFAVYASVKNKIRETIAAEFDIKKEFLYLTNPTFFSRLNNKTAITQHDEYWHPHIDRITYGTFFYTSLLYLSDYETDFTGGRFMFMDKYANKSVEPKMGRLSFFTSGSENKHFVEKVHSGTRYAITVSFTCDKQHSIADPS